MKERLKHMFSPHWLFLLVLTAVSAVGLLWTFAQGKEETMAAYLLYALSTYTLVSLCIRIPGLFRWGKRWAEKNPLSSRWLSDKHFRAKVSLWSSLALNSLFALFKLGVGVKLESWWEVTFGMYYMILALARFLLLRRWEPGANLAGEEKKRRRCGGLLLALTLPLSGMTVLIVIDGYGKQYPGYLIYAAALYTFYSVISAIVAQLRERKQSDSVLYAAKTVSLANAMVSLLGLQTAMFSAFGGEEQFQRMMNMATGGGVCISIFALGVWTLRAKPSKGSEGNDTGKAD